MYVCQIPNTIIVGSRETTIPALIRSQLTPAFEMKEFNATGTVYFEALLIIITAMNSSFQMLTKAKQKIAAMPGRVSGSTTWMIDCARVHPSILAASYRLTGILSKKLLDMMVQKAITVAT